MVAQTNRCDQRRLELLLSDQLGRSEQAVVAEHLESCVACRRALEQLAGDEQWWDEASSYLQTQAEDIAADNPTAAGETTGAEQLLSTDELGPVEFSLEFLGPSDNPAMIGRLGDYEILEMIGRGGMGVVLKGYQRELNRYVAIKVMAPHYAGSGPARKRFAREAQAAAAVVHPHVVAIHAVEGTAKLPYLVMPYVAACSLQSRLDQQGPLEIKEILRIGKQAAEGLAAAHAQGLVHRDVKPANILLEDDVGRVLLTDFGLARMIDDATMTRSGVIAGTPQYMSPEQAHGAPVDARTDLFSLGGVLYAMAAGHPPFRAETTMGVLRRICEEPPRPIRDVNSDVPDWLAHLIDNLLAKDPRQRYQSAGEVAELLGQCLAHLQQPTVAKLPESLQNLPQPNRIGSKRRRLAIWGAGMALVCLLAALPLVYFLGDWDASEKPPAAANALPPNGQDDLVADFDSSPPVWNDGANELIQQLDVDSARLEQRAEQAWDNKQPTEHFLLQENE